MAGCSNKESEKTITNTRLPNAEGLIHEDTRNARKHIGKFSFSLSLSLSLSSCTCAYVWIESKRIEAAKSVAPFLQIESRVVRHARSSSIFVSFEIKNRSSAGRTAPLLNCDG